ncbi:MAG: ferritin [Candidatus Eremiobacteraeota bacterium]|nr:ferritin [Candidatus Eremiobacteraeota bacterium]
MMQEKVQEAINKQVNAEIYSAYLYLSMNAYFQSLGLKGFANWMHVQSQEELIHAMRFYDYVNERSGRIRVLPIEGPPVEWKSPLDAFEAAYKHEQLVTSLINDLVNLATKEKDHATVAMLQWFVTEQVEEEANTSDVAGKLKLIGKDGAGLFMIDRELATRVFVPPPPAA